MDQPSLDMGAEPDARGMHSFYMSNPDPMAVSIAYNLTGPGWAECDIQIDEQCAHVTASYLSDAFGDLLRAAVGLMNGSEEETASFAAEPGEYRWRLWRTDPDKVRICILGLDELWGNQPDDEGETLLEVECGLRVFAGAVLSASQRVLQEYGLQGYKSKWAKHDFPLEIQHQLQHLLDPTEGRAA